MPEVGGMSSLSKIIKYSYHEEPSQQKLELKPFNFQKVTVREEDHESTSLAVLEEANKEAAQIRAAINEEYEQHQQLIAEEKKTFDQECEKLKEARYQQGYQEGYLVGERDAHHAYLELMTQAKNIVSQSEQDYHIYLASAEKDILNLAIEIAQKIIGDTLLTDSDAFLSLVRATVKEVRDQGMINIKVHPQWFDFLLQKKSEIESLTFDSKVRIYPDPDLETDACLIETPYGQIDGSVTSQLNELKEKLSELMESGRDGDEGN